MNLLNIKKDETLKKGEPCAFSVDISWYELHGGTVIVEASSCEEAQEIVEMDFDYYRNSVTDELGPNTFSDFGTDEIVSEPEKVSL